jgi:hypothetical protein
MHLGYRATIAGVLALVAMTGAAREAQAGTGAPLVWMVSTKALGLLGAEPGGAALTARFFNNPDTYVMAPRDQLALVPPRAIAVINFPSFAAFRSAIYRGRVDARYGAVLYDCEAWAATPVVEQKNPIYYYGLAAELAHRHGLKLIAAPATTLRKVLLCPTGPDTYPPFMETGIVGPIAKVADIFEIQSQGLLPQPDKYVDLVRDAAAEARAANPDIVFLAGLSTNPSGRAVTAAGLVEAVARTRAQVAGYWLNIPANSAFCEACGKSHPEVAAGLLRQLQNGGPAPQ